MEDRNPADVIRKTTEAEPKIHEERQARAAEMEAEHEARFHEETTEEIPEEPDEA